MRVRQVLDAVGLLGKLRKIRRVMGGRRIPRHPIQDNPTAKGFDLSYLGSPGCGWMIVDDPSLKDSIVISAGLGEDGSFDIEIARKYKATVHIIDPTPRAIEHFKLFMNRLATPSTRSYTKYGAQPVDAYEMTELESGQLVLHGFALWNMNGFIKFFQPKQEGHVSHSILNFQNNYSEETPYIEVEAVTLPDLIRNINVGDRTIALLKLDIEGAEIEVLMHALEVGILPNQILVEFDELSQGTQRSFDRVDLVVAKLSDSGYKLVYTNGDCDFLFFRALE